MVKYTKWFVVIGISLFLCGSSILPQVFAYKDSDTEVAQVNSFWKHKKVTHFNITNSYSLFTPERVLFGTAYCYNDFSIIPSGDSEFDPWLVWIDDGSGDCGAFEFENVATSNHGGCFLQIDTDGYIWVSRGGYADVVPFDLYKSNQPLSTMDYTGYTKKLDNYWTTIGACSPNVVLLDDKVNLFFRNFWNDDPNTEYQQLQYHKNDFTTQLINRYAVLGGYFEGYPIVPCYGWSRVDPRYDMGFLSFSFKHCGPDIWGSYPFIGITNDGSSFVKGDGSMYSIPLSYQSNIDIPLDNIYQNIPTTTYGVNSGVTPGGYYYLITHLKYNDTARDVRMFVYRNAQWNLVWQGCATAHCGFAVGVTKDYTVLIYGLGNEIFALTSEDDGQTWTDPIKIVETTDVVSGVAFAQPVLDYTDNTIRFFYGAHENNQYSYAYAKHRFIKFNAEDIANSPPDAPDIDGETQGVAGQPYDYTFTTVDPDGNEIWLWIEWGDGNVPDWQGPYDSEEPVVITKTFSGKGTYLIKAKAKDMYDKESDWGTLEVTMPVAQQYFSGSLFFRLIERFLTAFPILRELFLR